MSKDEKWERKRLRWTSEGRETSARKQQVQSPAAGRCLAYSRNSRGAWVAGTEVSEVREEVTGIGVG